MLAVFLNVPHGHIHLASTDRQRDGAIDQPQFEVLGLSYHSSLVTTPLVYESVTIRNRGDMLNLTDMWRAAGGNDSQRPYEWSRKDGGTFIEAVSITLNTPVERIYDATKGKGGSTFAHWQVGLAYAKYLSHDFHMWCNSVVRDHMEGVHRVAAIETMLAERVPVMIEEQVDACFKRYGLLTRHGQTANAIWLRHRLPKGIRGAAKWFGNRLVEMGCSIENDGRYDNGAKPIRLFDPDRADICMKNGLRIVAQKYVDERRGQGKLRLVHSIRDFELDA